MKFKIVHEKEDLKVGKHYILLLNLYDEILVKELPVILCLSSITGSNNKRLCFEGKYLHTKSFAYSDPTMLFLSDLEVSNNQNQLVEIINDDICKVLNDIGSLNIERFKELIKT